MVKYALNRLRKWCSSLQRATSSDVPGGALFNAPDSLLGALNCRVVRAQLQRKHHRAKKFQLGFFFFRSVLFAEEGARLLH